MIETTLYRCENCGTTYINRNECAACENSHVHLSVRNTVVNAQYLSKNPFPNRVTLRFDDGRFACYEYMSDTTPRR